jgi:hypothetical protein
VLPLQARQADAAAACLLSLGVSRWLVERKQPVWARTGVSLDMMRANDAALLDVLGVSPTQVRIRVQCALHKLRGTCVASAQRCVTLPLHTALKPASIRNALSGSNHHCNTVRNAMHPQLEPLAAAVRLERGDETQQWKLRTRHGAG